jgi:2-desacetyl-2-hydroxyethyl bacteriochlorophyllide A dehydrogenase
MRAVVYAGANTVRVEQVPEPHIQAPGDALVRVRLSAICGTDLHVIAGHLRTVEPGTVIGHEFVGEVIEVGAGVQRIGLGQSVMASNFAACGSCRWCERGDHWECGERAFFGTGTAFGPLLAGAQAEWVRVPHADTTLFPIPPGCSDQAALLVSDNLATGWVAVERGGVEPGDIVAVIGGGAVGQLASLSAQTAGAGAVVVVEPNATRRRFAEAHGALSAAPKTARDLVRTLADGDGADVVIDAVGGDGPLRAAFDLVRRRGRIVSVGTHSDLGFELPVARSFADELGLTFAIGDAIRLRSRLLALISHRALDPTVIISATMPLADAAAAYAQLADQRQLKVLLDPTR